VHDLFGLDMVEYTPCPHCSKSKLWISAIAPLVFMFGFCDVYLCWFNGLGLFSKAALSCEQEKLATHALLQ
jgi:hypothetical protein